MKINLILYLAIAVLTAGACSSPKQENRYIHGNTPWGYNRVRLLEKGLGQCVSGLQDLPEFEILSIETVERF